MSPEQGKGVGSGKKGGGRSLERGNCVRLGSARRSSGSEPGGDAEPRTSPWREKSGWGEVGEWPLPLPGWRSLGRERRALLGR